MFSDISGKVVFFRASWIFSFVVFFIVSPFWMKFEGGGVAWPVVWSSLTILITSSAMLYREYIH